MGNEYTYGKWAKVRATVCGVERSITVHDNGRARLQLMINGEKSNVYGRVKQVYIEGRAMGLDFIASSAADRYWLENEWAPQNISRGEPLDDDIREKRRKLNNKNAYIRRTKGENAPGIDHPLYQGE